MKGGKAPIPRPGAANIPLNALPAFNEPITVAPRTGCAADLQSPNTLTRDEMRGGWVLLFDGRTVNGWDDPRLKTPPGNAWDIEEGCLKAKAHPRTTEDLFTEQEFGDFELMFDWRISPAGNSGVKYRIQDHPFIAPHVHNADQETFEPSVERCFRNPSSTSGRRRARLRNRLGISNHG